MSSNFIHNPTPAQLRELLQDTGPTGIELQAKILDSVSSVLTVLKVDQNQLKRFARWIPNAISLVNLSMDNNSIGPHLPSSFTSLVSLRIFSMNNNSLQQLPIGLEPLSQLEIMRLDDNQIRFLPVSMKTLTNLIVLSVARNRLEGDWNFFPVSALSKLEELRLAGNFLNSPPQGVARLSRLKFFDWRPKFR
jgi:Leucine-rich repeat (LRR) protein